MLFFSRWSRPPASSLDAPPVPFWRRLLGAASPSGEALELLRIVREKSCPGTRVAAVARMADAAPADRSYLAQALIPLLYDPDPSVQGAAEACLSELLVYGKMPDRRRRRCISALRSLSEEARTSGKLLRWNSAETILRKVDDRRISVIARPGNQVHG